MIPLIFGIGTAMTSIVGANIGANNIERAERVGIYGGSTAGLVSVLIGFSLALFPDLWIHYFTDDPKAYEITKKYIQSSSYHYHSPVSQKEAQKPYLH